MIDFILFAGGGDFPAQTVAQSAGWLSKLTGGFLDSVPWDGVWAAIGAAFASFLAWWKALQTWQQIAIAALGIIAIAFMVF